MSAPTPPGLAGDQPDQLLPALPANTSDLLREGLEHAVPFNLHNAVRILEVAAGRGVAELPDAEHLKNHLGTQHGAALFAVAEAAAGAAYVGAFLEHLADIRMNVQEAHITYLQWAKGPITARSRLTSNPQELLKVLQNDGHVDLPMPCDPYDTQERVVATMTFRFYLKLVEQSDSGTTSLTSGLTHAAV